VKRKGDNAADPNALAWLLNPFSIESDMTGINQCLGESPAFHEADEKKESIDPHETVIPD
jgi:hypothetical protein